VQKRPLCAIGLYVLHSHFICHNPRLCNAVLHCHHCDINSAYVWFPKRWCRCRANGWLTLRTNLRLRARPPPTICAQLHRPVNALQFAADSFCTKKLYSRHSSREMQFYSENGHFAVTALGDLETTYAVLLRLIRKPAVVQWTSYSC